MTDHASLSHHPAPHRKRVGWEAVFGLVGGPLAWFIQFCVGYALASQPCFPTSQRALLPAQGASWTWPTMIALLVAAVLVALAAFVVSWHAFRKTRDEAGGAHHELMEVGSGRTRFIAFWGMMLSAGFGVTTLVTAVAFFILPRCAG